jgi:hypothetical protein
MFLSNEVEKMRKLFLVTILIGSIFFVGEKKQVFSADINIIIVSERDSGHAVILDSRSEVAVSNRYEVKRLSIDSPNNFKYYRLETPKNYGDNSLAQLAETEFLTNEYTVEIFNMIVSVGFEDVMQESIAITVVE